VLINGRTLQPRGQVRASHKSSVKEKLLLETSSRLQAAQADLALAHQVHGH
jgi:hypothetical protein